MYWFLVPICFFAGWLIFKSKPVKCTHCGSTDFFQTGRERRYPNGIVYPMRCVTCKRFFQISKSQFQQVEI